MSLATGLPSTIDGSHAPNVWRMRTEWIYTAVKAILAAVLLPMLGVPFAFLVVVYVIVHAFVTAKLRARLNAGDQSCRPAYLGVMFLTVLFWTGLACWIWSTSDALAHTAAAGILLVVPMLGAMRGYKDFGYLLVVCSIPFGAFFVLAFGGIDQLHDGRELVLAFAPLVFGVIALVRNVLHLRRQDKIAHDATAERNRIFNQLEQVTELSGVAGWDVELPSRTCTLTPAAMNVLGLSVQPTSLDSLLSHFTPESAAAFQAALRDAQKTAISIDVDAQMTTRDDAVRWIRLVGNVVEEESGASRFVGAMQDLTERFAALARSRQEEVDSALSRLSSRAAAEFKKDLNDVSRSLAELGKRGATGSLDHMLLQGMRLSLNRALDTAQSLQAFGANNPIEPGLVNLQKCISDVVIASSRLLPGNIALTFLADGAGHTAMLDPAEFKLSLLHLILNARDSMPEGGDLTITSGVEDNGMPFIEVRDTGAGIRPDMQAKIFEPFFTTKRASGARGLGLSIVRGFVDQAGGRLDVKSEPGVGSRFRMVFPVAVSMDALVIGIADAMSDIRGTILLTHEDEKILHDLGPALLQEGLILHYARSARDALPMLDGKVKYDGILLSEEQLRSLPGQVLIARLPRQWPHTKIAVLSAATRDHAHPLAGLMVCIPSSEPASEIAQRVAAQIWDDQLNSIIPA